MPFAPYAPLPTQHIPDDPTREMNKAFEDDGESVASDNDHESTPLNPPRRATDTPSHYYSPVQSAIGIPGSYDFEKDYDYIIPPPGSPPGPSASARPNNHGNSNGLVPSPSVVIAGPSRERGSPSFFRRAVGTLLPSHYQQVPIEAPTSRIVGGGVDNDGVFANVVAKPARGPRTIASEDGSIYLAPEETQKDVPPTYAEAQTDSVPPYWETTVVAPDSGDMIVNDLPTGSVSIFAFNVFASFFFQFIGFIITYFISNTHAARYGSMAGLGLTFIQFGAYWRSSSLGNGDSQEAEIFNGTYALIPNTSAALDQFLDGGNSTNKFADFGHYNEFGWKGKDWAALLFITFGWLLFISSVVSFWRVKRWEMSIRTSSSQSPPSIRENVERDVQISHSDDHEYAFEQGEEGPENAESNARAVEYLRAAGLI